MMPRFGFAAFATVAAVVFLCAGCGPSTDKLGETVKSGLQTKLDTEPALSRYHMSVSAVSVMHSNGNEYKGIATVEYNGVSHDVPIEVTADGEKMMWKVDQGGFGFLVDEALKGFNLGQ